MSVPDNKDADTDNNYSNPAQERHGFSQKKIAQQRDYGVRKRGSRLNVTVIRPGEHEHVGHKKSEQTGDSQPNVARCKDPGENVKKIGWRPISGGADPLHSLTEQDVAEGRKQDYEQNKNVSLQVQARRVFHTLLSSTTYSCCTVPGFSLVVRRTVRPRMRTLLRR